MQTLHAGCSKEEPTIFASPQTPFLGARDGQNLISWSWSLLLPTNQVFWGSMHAISSYRGNRSTHTHTHTHTYTNTHTPGHPPSQKQTGPITIHCAAAARSVVRNSQSDVLVLCRCAGSVTLRHAAWQPRCGPPVETRPLIGSPSSSITFARPMSRAGLVAILSTVIAIFSCHSEENTINSWGIHNK